MSARAPQKSYVANIETFIYTGPKRRKITTQDTPQPLAINEKDCLENWPHSVTANSHPYAL